MEYETHVIRRLLNNDIYRGLKYCAKLRLTF